MTHRLIFYTKHGGEVESCHGSIGAAYAKAHTLMQDFPGSSYEILPIR